MSQNPEKTAKNIKKKPKIFRTGKKPVKNIAKKKAKYRKTGENHK